MEKQDLMYGLLALGIIVVIALVIKPIATGQAVDFGLPTPSPEVTPVEVVPETPALPETVVPDPTPVPTTLPPATPRPTWQPGSTSVGFVDPSQYGISMNYSLPGGTRFDSAPENTTMVVFSTINGQYSGTTGVFSMPFPYWEIWYNVEPSGLPMGKSQSLSTSTITGPKESGVRASGASISVMQGSYSVTNPQFNLQVMDGNDPNRIVRTITPPGGLDKSLWTSKTDDEGNVISSDPRPWVEKFYEGDRDYFFVINTQSLDSYTIEIRVPLRYLGQV